MKEKNERKKTNRKEEKGRRKGVKNRMCRDAGARAGTGLTVIAIALALSLCVFAQSVLAAQISVYPPCQIVTKGDYFTVDIYADPEGNETWSASYILYFNNTLLNATFQVNGSFLSQDGANTVVFPNETNNSAGRIEYGETRTKPPSTTGVTDPGVLATITFEALADGFCELGLGDWGGATTELVDVNLTSISTNVSNGSVRIDLCGDVDNDEDVDIFDVFAVYKRYQYGEPLIDEWAGDADGDDDIDIFDVFAVYKRYQYGESLNCRCGA